MTGEPLGFSLVAVGYLSYHREFMLPLVLAHKSLIFIRDSRKSWRCALVTEGKRDPTKACVQDLMFMSRGDRNLGVVFRDP